MFTEALRNFIHREVFRVLDRRTRRTPCQVSSYNGQTHTVKVTLLPEGTLSGWMQIEEPQHGEMHAPNIDDFGWIEFHENDRRAGTFVAAVHNNNAPPPKQINAGEYYKEIKSGQSIYLKNDGSIAMVDAAGTSIVTDGKGSGVMTAKVEMTVNAPAINLSTGEGTTQPIMLADNTPSLIVKAQ